MTTLTERDILALTLWGEARGEPVEGIIAVACVLRNRLHSGRWGGSYERVCLAPKQFSCWNPVDVNHPQLERLVEALQRGESPANAALRECDWIADGLLRQAIRPRIGACLHYYATSMPIPPAWAATGRLYETIGSHVFLEGIA